MAPTPVANSSIPLQTGQAFAGDEFSNNLFSDLAPLLTLFGEQVTKQFLSLSMGWADDILLAMGPLGIMTVIVSAIRVGGVKLLKAFVGRARESRANAEKEILSSTSEDVCELWSGHEIIRELGNPEGMKDLILVEKPVPLDPEGRHRGPMDLIGGQREAQREQTRVLDIHTAVTARVLRLRPDQLTLTEEELLNISNGAPNIALNVRNSTASSRELVGWAVTSTILQLSALVFPAVTTYYWKWTKGGSVIAAYGYPCFAAGTIMVALGMIFCGRVIEGSTTEHEFIPILHPTKSRIMRLQKACTVSDQHFPSYAIFNSPKDMRIRTSRLNNKSYSQMAAIATLTAVVGFVFQFVGLRALHWSATIYQLGVMLVLTIVRSWARRGLSKDPIFYPLLDGHELAWLVFYVLGTDQKGWVNDPKDHQHSTMPGLISNVGPAAEDQYVELETVPPVGQQDGRPRLQPVSSSLKIEEPPGTSSKTSRLTFSMSFPFIKRIPVDPASREPQPFERMLEPHIRWEPLTGYYNVDKLGSSLTHSRRRSGTFATLPIIEGSKAAQSYLSLAYVLPERLKIERAADSKSDYQPLDICRDLQRLMPISDEVANIATTLARAIEGTMALLAKTSCISWLDKADPFLQAGKTLWEAGTLRFGVKIVTGTYSPGSRAQVKTLNLDLRQKSPKLGVDPEVNERRFSMWSIDREILLGILHLWLFSLELRRNAAKKASAVLDGPLYRELMGYSLDGYQLLSRRNVYFRIVGPLPAQVTPGSGGLNAWFTSPFDYLPLLGEDYADGMVLERRTGPDVNTWVVWGSNSSASFVPSISRYRDRISRDTWTGQDAANIAVRTRPETTLAGHCALELYACFIDSIAAKIKKVGGRTMKSPPVSPDAGPHLWRNSFFESVANECVSAGLAYDVEEANTVILPSFAKYDLLPKEIHEEIVFEREIGGGEISRQED